MDTLLNLERGVSDIYANECGKAIEGDRLSEAVGVFVEALQGGNPRYLGQAVEKLRAWCKANPPKK